MIKGPKGKLIGIAGGAKTAEEAVNELANCLDEYGKETVWTVDIGTIIYERTRKSSIGFFKVRE